VSEIELAFERFRLSKSLTMREVTFQARSSTRGSGGQSQAFLNKMSKFYECLVDVFDAIIYIYAKALNVDEKLVLLHSRENEYFVI
jgi:hypothetical protein